MAVTPWSVVAGQTPSAAFWNILGTNDAALAAGTAIDDDAILARHIDWASTGASGGIWWEELGRTTLSGAADIITVSSLPARKYLEIMVFAIATGGTIGTALTLNGDTGANYASRASNNGGADSTAVSQSSIGIFQSTASTTIASVSRVMNVSTLEKILTTHVTQRGTSGAANAPTRLEIHSKWANTANAISSVTITNTGTGDFAIGSEVVVLGHN